MKRSPSNRALEAEYLADLAMLDELIAGVSRTAAVPEPRVFNQTWVDEHGEKRYDWEIIGTGMSVRELEDR